MKKKYSQTEIAAKMGYSIEYISRILNGKDKMNLKFVSKFKECYPEFDNNINNEPTDQEKLIDSIQQLVKNNSILVETNSLLSKFVLQYKKERELV